MRRVIRILFFFALIFHFCYCSREKPESVLKIDSQRKTTNPINDSSWVKNKSFAFGDIRRYGFSNKSLSKIKLDSIIDLGSKGIDIVFPQGMYYLNFNIINKKDINFHFENATIAGKLSFQNSENITVTGDLKILDILFLKESNNISFEKVHLKTDKANNINKKANRGVNIYSGCHEVFFDTLEISDFGGEGLFYQYSQAALMIHGFFDTPEAIKFKNVLIKNSKRTGVYISGKDHYMQKLRVVNYGLSKNTLNIKAVESASDEEQKVFSGVWMNRTENNTIDTLIVSNNLGHGNYSVIFDESKGTVPNIINSISISDKNAYQVNLDSNTLVLNEF